MPCEGNKILEFDQYQKSDKAPFIIYADFECIIEKSNWSKSNPKTLSKKKQANIFCQVFQFLENLRLEA